MAVTSFTKSGAKATSAAKLNKAIFAIEVTNHQLLKDAYVAYNANGRLNLAKTLKRGEVSGGGKKPWRQKGTGNARTGSIRNPIWRGGGITFGPSGAENYTKKLSTSARQQALRQALSLAAAGKTFNTIESFEVKSGKTKDAIALLAKLTNSTRTVVVVDTVSPETVRACSNVESVRIVLARSLSVVDVLDAQTLIVTNGALEALDTRLGGTK